MESDAKVRAGDPIAITPLTLVAMDGVKLGATLFEPTGTALGTVVIHGATATPARYYRHFAGFLAAHGVRALSYDYRGIADSRPPHLRGFSADLTAWAKLDAVAAHAFVREHFAGTSVATVGHSFGGQLIGLLDELNDASSAVLVGSQLGYFGHWDGPLNRLRLGLIWRALVPTLTASFGYLPGSLGIGEPLPRGVAEEWARWCCSPSYLMAHHADARQRFARFVRPVLSYSFDDDELAPPRAVSALLAQLSNAPITHRKVAAREFGGSPIGHFGFFRARFASSLWHEALSFLTDALERQAQVAAA